MKKKFLSILFAITMIMALPLNASANDERNANLFIAKATASAGNTIKLTWIQVPDAKQYQISASLHGKPSTTIADLSANGTTSSKSYIVKKIDGKKLKAHKIYEFEITAHDGSKFISRSNIPLTCICGNTYGKKYQYANPTKVNIKYKNINLEKGNKVSAVDMAKITSTIYKNKKHLSSSYGKKYRYITNRPDILTISEIGTIKVNPNANIGSSAKVTVQEINGVYNTFNVNIVKPKATEATVKEPVIVVPKPTYPYPYPFIDEDGYYYGNIKYSKIEDTTTTLISNINTKYQNALNAITGTDLTSQNQKIALQTECEERCNMVRGLKEYILFNPTPNAYEAYVHEINKIYSTNIGYALIYDNLLRELKNNM